MAQAQGGLAIGEPARVRSRRFGMAAWFTALLIFGLALLPRCIGLADFVTLDEGYHWVYRVRDFTFALQAGDWVSTNLTGHPGVTTMWLGSLGRWMAWLLSVPTEHPLGLTTAYLALLRLPLATVNSAAVGVGYLLLRRLLRPGTALLAALLWATAPFLIGFSRLLHVDGLVTSFSTLAVLLLLVAVKDDGRRMMENDRPPTDDDRRPATDDQSFAGNRLQASSLQSQASSPKLFGRAWLLVASGVCTGLALASKSSALALPPWCGIVLLVAVAVEARAGASWRATVRRAWLAVVGRVAARYLLWLGVAVLTFFVVWPAMWVDPRGAIGNVIFDLTDNAAVPHASGNFFLGQPVAVPDWRFYAVVIVLRGTPLLLLGLLALVPALRQARGWPAERAALLGLAWWAILFFLAVSFAEKKFDRYLLPAWPALEILAAAGLVALGRLALGLIRSNAWRERARPWLRTGAPLLLAAGMLAVDRYYHPYYMAFYNPLFGGGATAENVILVGWGEGMEQIGAWLRERPDLERGPVLSWIPPTLQPFVPRGLQVLDIRESTVALRSPAPNYAVLYARGAWRQETPIPEAIIRRTPPLFTLKRYGITYATIHQMPRPFDTPLDARFGDGLTLYGFSERREKGSLVIAPSWGVTADQPGNIWMFAHVLAPDGRRVGQVDAPIDEGMFKQWQAGQQFGGPISIALPADLPAGQYRVVLGVYRPEGGPRLPIVRGQALPESVDGPQALLLATLAVP